MSWVNDRDVAQLGPALLPHVAALGRRPRALAASAIHRRRRRSICCTAPTTTSIPAVESELLAADLRARGGRVTQLSTPLITHAEVDHPPAAPRFGALVRFWAGPL